MAANRIDRSRSSRPLRSPRAVPIVEAMTALVLIDHRMRHHAQCESLFLSGINERKASHLISGLPDRKTNISFLPSAQRATDKSLILCSQTDGPCRRPIRTFGNGMIKNKFEFKGLPESSEVDFFFSSQTRSTSPINSKPCWSFLPYEKDLSMGRVFLFLNSTSLPKTRPLIDGWIDAAGHFSRTRFATRIEKMKTPWPRLQNRYSSMRYPLETYVLEQENPLDTILNTNPVARRISHLF